MFVVNLKLVGCSRTAYAATTRKAVEVTRNARGPGQWALWADTACTVSSREVRTVWDSGEDAANKRQCLVIVEADTLLL